MQKAKNLFLVLLVCKQGLFDQTFVDTTCEHPPDILQIDFRYSQNKQYQSLLLYQVNIWKL